MPRRRHALAGLVTPLQLRNAHMVDDPSHVRLPRIMAHRCAAGLNGVDA
jgi:hypothetical protein